MAQNCVRSMSSPPMTWPNGSAPFGVVRTSMTLATLAAETINASRVFQVVIVPSCCPRILAQLHEGAK